MIAVKQQNPLPSGTVIEFLKFDKNKSTGNREKRLLSIGHHYLVADTIEFFTVSGLYNVVGKDGREILLAEDQYRVVKPVQKPIAQLSTPLNFGITNGYFYEIESFGINSLGVSCQARLPMTKGVFGESNNGHKVGIRFDQIEIMAIKGNF
ncbi:hypothetical protein COPG_00035 [Colwellia phage 9A]|uniref:Uncharacterized protein n=1 Tax=Colwellia phage 9A TaxID=765765 RepID=I3UMB6_9CAUD|nr:hypothetical protein COPG_00035 [Colwellia phage 9A]AFK66631.1 hypothetical protein COPG_00035 [Colwellia phage 9A]